MKIEAAAQGHRERVGDAGSKGEWRAKILTFLLMKRMQRSRHLRQQRRQFTANRTRHDLSISCFILWSRYSKTARASCTSATMSAPKAIEP